MNLFKPVRRKRTIIKHKSDTREINFGKSNGWQNADLLHFRASALSWAAWICFFNEPLKLLKIFGYIFHHHYFLSRSSEFFITSLEHQHSYVDVGCCLKFTILLEMKSQKLHVWVWYALLDILHKLLCIRIDHTCVKILHMSCKISFGKCFIIAWTLTILSG